MASKTPNNIIQIDKGLVQSHLKEAVKVKVEEKLNVILTVKANPLCKAEKNEHSVEHQDTRADYYTHNLDTIAGRVELKVTKFRKLFF